MPALGVVRPALAAKLGIPLPVLVPALGLVRLALAAKLGIPLSVFVFARATKFGIPIPIPAPVALAISVPLQTALIAAYLDTGILMLIDVLMEVYEEFW